MESGLGDNFFSDFNSGGFAPDTYPEVFPTQTPDYTQYHPQQQSTHVHAQHNVPAYHPQVQQHQVFTTNRQQLVPPPLSSSGPPPAYDPRLMVANNNNQVPIQQQQMQQQQMQGTTQGFEDESMYPNRKLGEMSPDHSYDPEKEDGEENFSDEEGGAGEAREDGEEYAEGDVAEDGSEPTGRGHRKRKRVPVEDDADLGDDAEAPPPSRGPKKQRRSAMAASAEWRHLVPEAEEAPPQEDEEEENATANAKKGRGGKKKGKEHDAVMLEKIKLYKHKIEQLAKKMVEAKLKDDRDVRNSNMALAKLAMLDEVVKFLLLRNPEDDFSMDKNDPDKHPINVHFLTSLAIWLGPLPGGGLPSLKVRESILKHLGKVTVTPDVLKTSGIGKAVMLLSKHKQELEANKRICKQLISQWSRPIFGITTNYAEGGMESTYRAQPRMNRPSHHARPALTDAFETGYQDNSPSATFAQKFPQKSTFDFQHRPESVKIDKKPKVRTKEQQLASAMQGGTRGLGGKKGSGLGLVRLPRASDK